MAESLAQASAPEDERLGAVTVFLVRHAKAGDRELWTEPDHIRPVTKKGRRQAEGLVDLLRQEDVKRVLSSPYARCVQTVEPMAADRGLTIEQHDALAEGALLRDTLALIEDLAEQAPVLCTHGDVVGNVIAHLEGRGVPGADQRLCKKGSTWVLTTEGGRVTGAAYHPPPSV